MATRRTKREAVVSLLVSQDMFSLLHFTILSQLAAK